MCPYVLLLEEEKKLSEIRNITKKNKMVDIREKEKPKDHMINMENRYFFDTKALKNMETVIRDLNILFKFKLEFLNKDREIEIVSVKKVYCIALYSK